MSLKTIVVEVVNILILDIHWIVRGVEGDGRLHVGVTYLVSRFKSCRKFTEVLDLPFRGPAPLTLRKNDRTGSWFIVRKGLGVGEPFRDVL